jgi:hypothetical protein
MSGASPHTDATRLRRRRRVGKLGAVTLKRGNARSGKRRHHPGPFHIDGDAGSHIETAPERFEAIVVAHHAEIHRYLRRVGAHAAEADDLSLGPVPCTDCRPDLHPLPRT